MKSLFIRAPLQEVWIKSNKKVLIDCSFFFQQSGGEVGCWQVKMFHLQHVRIDLFP